MAELEITRLTLWIFFGIGLFIGCAIGVVGMALLDFGEWVKGLEI